MADQSRATGLIAKEGIELLTWATPNGYKASIILEELKEAYGKDYVYQAIPIGDNIQKEPWFTKLGPNGRIPVIVDHDKGDFAVMEGMAILTYLTRHYDPENKFWFDDPFDQSTAEQWMAWQHGGLGPMQGQANHFYRLASERHPYGTQRYVGESERLYGVLNDRLESRDYLAGAGRGKYSIADIASWGWVHGSMMVNIDIKEKFPNVSAWYDRLLARPAVLRGAKIPTGSLSKLSIPEMRKTKEEDPEAFEKREKPFRDELEKAQAQYKYVYKSP